MRKLFNKLFKKKAPKQDFLASIGYTYLEACRKDRQFRRQMEKTTFGKAIKQHIINARNEAAN